MNAFLGLPIEFRMTLVAIGGIFAGAVANVAIYTLCYKPRPISPWSRKHPRDAMSGWLDRVPLLGWWRLRRQAQHWGSGFWCRPLVLELTTAAAGVALYWWETERLALLPPGARLMGPLLEDVHAEFFAHAVLGWLMLVASMIDVDEKMIPDSVTLPGTLLGLTFAAACPWSLLPAGLTAGGRIDYLTFVSIRNAWPVALDGPLGLLISLGCCWFWCLALMPRLWWTAKGYSKAVRFFLAHLVRSRATWWLLILGVVVSLGILGVWMVGGPHWQGLLTSLVGLLAGTILVWGVRIVGSWALRREAMGFGDVTLLAMIGSFLGWQASVLVFFLAPFAGLVVGILRWVVHRRNDIPYGPFLCLASVVVVVGWHDLWAWGRGMFMFGWLVPAAFGFCLVVMGLLLGLWRLITTWGVPKE